MKLHFFLDYPITTAQLRCGIVLMWFLIKISDYFYRIIPEIVLKSGIRIVELAGRATSAPLCAALVSLRLHKLTGHVDVLFAGEPDARVKLPHHVLVLASLPDILHQPRVVQVGTVEPDAERLLGGDRAGTERLHHFTRALAPVAGGESRHGQEQCDKVQGESQRCSPLPVYPHDGGVKKSDPSPRMTQDFGDFSFSLKSS